MAARHGVDEHDDDEHQLGHDDEEHQHTPKLIEALRGKKVVQVSAGSDHSLVLLEGGGLMSFGYGQHGSLGHGDDGHYHDTPKLIEALRGKGVVQVSAGSDHSLVLLEGGGVMSFGDAREGSLGHGNEEHQHTPKLIEALRGKRVLQVSGGDGHSLVLLEEGGVMSFGSGADGQLGHGDYEHHYTPKLIGVVAQGVHVVEVAAGCGGSVLLGQAGEVRHVGDELELRSRS